MINTPQEIFQFLLYDIGYAIIAIIIGGILLYFFRELWQ